MDNFQDNPALLRRWQQDALGKCPGSRPVGQNFQKGIIIFKVCIFFRVSQYAELSLFGCNDQYTNNLKKKKELFCLLLTGYDWGRLLPLIRISKNWKQEPWVQVQMLIQGEVRIAQLLLQNILCGMPVCLCLVGAIRGYMGYMGRNILSFPIILSVRIQLGCYFLSETFQTPQGESVATFIPQILTSA